MALIKCPECDHEVSDKAKACPHCGCPIENHYQYKYDIILNTVDVKQKLSLIGFLRMLTNCDLSTGKQMTENLPKTILYNLEETNANNIAERLRSYGCTVSLKENTDQDETASNVVKNDIPAQGLICPRCGSTAVTTGQKGFTLLTGFLGSNKTVNRCGKCGYVWEP